jgi:hypothetical protein
MKAIGALIAAVVSVEVTPSEAAELSKLIKGYLTQALLGELHA